MSMIISGLVVGLLVVAVMMMLGDFRLLQVHPERGRRLGSGCGRRLGQIGSGSDDILLNTGPRQSVVVRRGDLGERKRSKVVQN